MPLKSLVEENERLAQQCQTAFEAAGDAIFVLDAEQRVLRCNRAAEAAFGCSRAEMIGRRCYEIVHGTAAPIPDCPFGPMRRSLQRESLEMQFGERWFAVTTDPILDEAGRLTGAVHIARENTAQKRGEEALQESERRLTTLMANLPGMAYRCQNRPDWPMEFVSEGCAGLTGWPAPALLQNRPAYGELIVETDRQPVWDAVQEALKDRRPYELTYRIQTAGGHLRWVWERGCGVFAPDDSLLHLEGFITDITNQHRAEEALRRYAEELRIRNEALTRFNAVTVGRELRMIELKREVNELCMKLGAPSRYEIAAVPQGSDTVPEDGK